MLLNKGRHPYTNVTIIPEEVVERVAYGRSVSHGKAEFSELVSNAQELHIVFNAFE